MVRISPELLLNGSVSPFYSLESAPSRCFHCLFLSQKCLQAAAMNANMQLDFIQIGLDPGFEKSGDSFALLPINPWFKILKKKTAVILTQNNFFAFKKCLPRLKLVFLSMFLINGSCIYLAIPQ